MRLDLLSLAVCVHGDVAAGFDNTNAMYDDLMQASGLNSKSIYDDLGVADPTKSKYDDPQSTQPKFPATPGTHFSGVFSDHVVLQRAPSKSAVYGVVFGAEAGTGVNVQVSSSATGTYNVQARVDTTRLGSDPLGYATWKAFLKPADAGGNYTINASCSGCKYSNVTSALNDVTFGDVWFCSGQSNMWLPMNMDTSRNQSYDAVLAGKYKNIRMHTTPHNNQPDGGWNGTDLDILKPPNPWNPYGGTPGGGWALPDVGTYANKTCRDGHGKTCPDPHECCTAYPLPNQDWLYNNINQFSSACWHFAEHLTDIMETNGEPVVPLGLIGSHWGGTEIEHWQPNATLNVGVCKNNSGGAYTPSQNQRYDENDPLPRAGQMFSTAVTSRHSTL